MNFLNLSYHLIYAYMHTPYFSSFLASYSQHNPLQADLHQRLATQLQQLVQLCPPDQVSDRTSSSHSTIIIIIWPPTLL